MSQVRLVFEAVRFAAAVIPSLVPAEARELGAVICQFRELRCQVDHALFHACDEVLVLTADAVSPWLATGVGSGAGGAPGSGQAGSTRPELQEEDGVVEEVAHHPAEAQFGTDGTLGSPTSHPQFALSVEPGDPHILPGDPLAVPVQVSIAGCGGGVPGDGFKGSFLFPGNAAVAFHVRLSGQDEDPDDLFFRKGGPGKCRNGADEKQGEKTIHARSGFGVGLDSSRRGVTRPPEIGQNDARWSAGIDPGGYRGSGGFYGSPGD